MLALSATKSGLNGHHYLYLLEVRIICCYSFNWSLPRLQPFRNNGPIVATGPQLMRRE